MQLARRPLCPDTDQIPLRSEMTRWANKRLMHRSKQHLNSITLLARLSNVAGISMAECLGGLEWSGNRVLNYCEFSFGRNCAFRFNFQRVVQRGLAFYVLAVMARSDLRSYSSKSWLVPRFSLQNYCTANAVSKALPLAAIVLKMLMTTLQERLTRKLSSSCLLVLGDPSQR